MPIVTMTTLFSQPFHEIARLMTRLPANSRGRIHQEIWESK